MCHDINNRNNVSWKNPKKADNERRLEVEPECLNSLSSLCGGTFQLDFVAFKINSFDNVARQRADFRSSRVAPCCSLVPPDTQAGCNRCGSGVLQTRLGNGKRTRRDLRCTSHHSCMDSARKDCSRSHKAGLGNFKKELINKYKTVKLWLNQPGNIKLKCFFFVPTCWFYFTAVNVH